MDKRELRVHYRKIRDNLSSERHFEASSAVFDAIREMADSHTFVLSYASFQSELDMTRLNEWLARQGKLLLPCCDFGIFHVLSCKADLHVSSWGILEPNPCCCEKVSVCDASLILVPGIAFDLAHHRLGYGKGFYDQLLSKKNKAITVGVGFREQLYEGLLPIGNHDVALTELLLA